MNQNNIGRFCIPLEWIKKNPDEIASLFKQMNFVAVRAEIIDMGRTIDYVGLSVFFRDVGTGGLVPYYTFDILKNPDGTVTLSPPQEKREGR